MAEKPSESKKTATGLNRLGELNTKIDELLNADPITVDPTSLPKPSQLPTEQPAPMDTSMATKIMRALTVFGAGANNPEQGLAMIKQFEAQDAAARDAVQQRFANAMAMAQAQQQRVEFTEQVRAGRMDEAQAQREFKANVLALALRGLEDEIRFMQSTGAPERETSFYTAQHKMMLDAVDNAKEQQGISETPTTQELESKLGGPVEIIFAARNEGIPQEEINKAMETPEGQEQLKAFVVQRQQDRWKATKVRANQPLLEIRARLAADPNPLSQHSLSVFDSMVQALPDPRTGDKGDPVAVAANATILDENNPELLEANIDAMAEMFLANNWAADPVEADHLANEVAFGRMTFDAVRERRAAFEGVKAGKGAVEKGASAALNLVDDLFSGRAMENKAVRKALLVGDKTPTPEEKKKVIAKNKASVKEAKRSAEVAGADSLFTGFKPTLVIGKKK